MGAREELAAVLESVVADLNERGVISDGYGWEEIADAILASPALARLLDEARREAWDEGWEAGSEDETNAYWGPAGSELTPNPYRADRIGGEGDA